MAFEKILPLLEDGDWHAFAEIRGSNMSEDELRMIVRFLEEFGFLDVDEKQNTVKLRPPFLQLPV